MADKILVYPCMHYMQTRETEQTVRKILFGKKMKLFPGGWSYLDRDGFLKAPRSSTSLSTEAQIEQVGVSFMKTAQEQWKNAKQKTQLFPIDGGFKLVKREVVQIIKSKVNLGWRVSWDVLAQPGRQSKTVHSVAKDFLAVDHASIVLFISRVGRVVGGNAHWRLASKPRAVDQLVLPKNFVAHIEAAKSKAKGGDDHGHTHGQSSAGGKTPGALMNYAVGARTEFRNFIDPYLRLVEKHAHSHSPPLIVPVTKFGVHAEILTRTRAVGSIKAGTGEIEVIPWVNMHDGAKNPTHDKRIKGHWTLIPRDAAPTKAPKKVPLGAPLKLQGLYEVALTVQTVYGGISHAHTELCSAVAPRGKPPNPNLPVS